MDSIINFISVIFNNANNISLLGIFVTVFISYHIAVYTSGRPFKLQIKDQQLNLVYSPLHRILKEVSCIPAYDDAVKLYEKISAVIDANYELTFPQLHHLNTAFGTHLTNHTDYSDTLKLIIHQVSIEHSLLKRSLGYPCENAFSLFVRMTFWQKFEFLLGYLNMLGILLFLVSFTYFSNMQSNIDDVVFASLIAYFYVFLFAGNICFILHASTSKHEH